MKRLYIGIDFSLNSCGICFKSEDKIHHLSLVNIFSQTTAKKPDPQYVMELKPMIKKISEINNVTFEFTYRTPMLKKSSHYDNGRKRLKDSEYLAKLYFNKVREVLGIHFPEYTDEQIHVGIEDYSYGSAADNVVQICEITTVFKHRMFTEICTNPNNWHLVSGPGVKMFAGKGNYDKYQMTLAYLANKEDKVLTSSSLFAFINENFRETYTVKSRIKTRKIKKVKTRVTEEVKEMLTPIDDLVDSYWVARWTENINSLEPCPAP